MEEPKCLEPSGSGSRIGDRASVQAATRVNAEPQPARERRGGRRELWVGGPGDYHL